VRLGLLLLAALPGFLPADALDDAWAALDAADPGSFAEKRAAVLLEATGAQAALRGLSTFEAASATGRRVRAELAREEGDEQAITPALLFLREPDPAVRADLARFLGERRLLDAAAAQRTDALGSLARDDADAGVRAAAIEGLATIPVPGALAELDRLLDLLAGEERILAARTLAGHAGARERVVRRVVRAFSTEGDAGRPLDAETLAVLLDAYGEALVHVPGGGAGADERRPFHLGREHPAPIVRLAARTALEALFAGLARESDAERAYGVFDGLRADGFPALELAYRRATYALTSDADPAPARAAAAEILARTRGREDSELREWRVRGALLMAGAELAALRFDAALALCDEAERVLSGLAADRPELLPSPREPSQGNVDRAASHAHLAALIDLWRATLWLASGRPPGDAELQAYLRGMYVRQLEAAIAGSANHARVPLDGFQPLLDDNLGPVNLVLSNPDAAAWPRARALALLADLGRALAGVSAFELPGFEPASDVEALRDPLADPERRQLLERLLAAELEGVEKELYEALDRDERDEEKELRLLMQQLRLRADVKRLREGSVEVLRAHRSVSDFAHELALSLLTDGNAEEARRLCERMKADLAAAAALGAGPVSEPLVAELEATIGSAWMDDGRPAEAEAAFLQAAARLKAYEAELKDNQGPGAGDPERKLALALWIENVRSQRSDVLLSLAVNANVRQNDQEKALDYFEQAFELKQNDFLRVLLACYRARSGRAAEARAILAEVEGTPVLYYNLACTHALLGDQELALDYLARELAENHASERSRARQAEWARADPDLESLRAHPRFERLLGGG
jgi:hypothetical protein